MSASPPSGRNSSGHLVFLSGQRSYRHFVQRYLIRPDPRVSLSLVLALFLSSSSVDLLLLLLHSYRLSRQATDPSSFLVLFVFFLPKVSLPSSLSLLCFFWFRSVFFFPSTKSAACDSGLSFLSLSLSLLFFLSALSVHHSPYFWTGSLRRSALCLFERPALRAASRWEHRRENKEGKGGRTRRGRGRGGREGGDSKTKLFYGVVTGKEERRWPCDCFSVEGGRKVLESSSHVEEDQEEYLRSCGRARNSGVTVH